MWCPFAQIELLSSKCDLTILLYPSHVQRLFGNVYRQRGGGGGCGIKLPHRAVKAMLLANGEQWHISCLGGHCAMTPPLSR
jgi:hypothetical protein